MRAAVLGANGLVGREIVRVLTEAGHHCAAIIRSNYRKLAEDDKWYDVLINANGNSKKFWANNNPSADFMASVYSVQRSMFDFKFGAYIYISSADVYGDLILPKEIDSVHDKVTSHYAFNKLLAEQVVKKYAPKYHILRCSAIVGQGLKKGPVYDIINGKKMWVSMNSQYQLISNTEIAEICLMLSKRFNYVNSIFNVGGHGAVPLWEVAELYNVKPKMVFGGRSEDYAKEIYEMNVTNLAAFHALKESMEYVRDMKEDSDEGVE